MKNTTIRTSLCVSLVAALAACQPAHKSNHHGESTADSYFSAMDSNNDGVITRGETRIYADSEFKTSDVNRDGVITRTEFRAMKHQKIGVDKPGFSRSEMNSNDPRRTQHVDRSHDNVTHYSNNPRDRVNYSSYDRDHSSGDYYYDRNSKRWERR